MKSEKVIMETVEQINSTFQRSWSRPAAINAHMKRGTDFRNYNT